MKRGSGGWRWSRDPPAPAIYIRRFGILERPSQRRPRRVAAQQPATRRTLKRAPSSLLVCVSPTPRRAETLGPVAARIRREATQRFRSRRFRVAIRFAAPHGRDSGRTWQAIADGLNRDGVPTARRGKRVESRNDPGRLNGHSLAAAAPETHAAGSPNQRPSDPTSGSNTYPPWSGGGAERKEC